MKILVCGGRDYTDQTQLFDTLDQVHETAPITTIIHGAARGADTLAGRWAAARGISCDVYPADWQRDGRRAGYIRNQRMLDNSRPDAVVAFPGGPGTADMVRLAKQRGLNILRVPRTS